MPVVTYAGPSPADTMSRNRSAEAAVERPDVVAVGNNPTLIWGMTAEERLRRICAAEKLRLLDVGGTLLANLRFVFDPAWMSYLAKRPGTVLTRDGIPVLAHAAGEAQSAAILAAMNENRALPADIGASIIAAEDERGIFNDALRKRERPFAELLIASNIPRIERASYVGAYKGVTDLLTKYLWPEWAFALTRLAVRLGITPNQVTAVGSFLCIVATIAFWHGWFWSGLALGLAFMVLDTVDGKLARCTITSSSLGNIWDHGVDLIHPPFWWWAWAEGCSPYGRPLDSHTFFVVMAAILFGYVAQRAIEGVFIARFGMHIHVWRRFDSQFRLITARRNPNMPILLAFLLVGRPDWGIIAVAAWTMISLLIHLVRLLQALWASASGQPITSWLA